MLRSGAALLRTDGWEYEDQLGDITNAQYSAMYPLSRLPEGSIGVRVFPYRLVNGERVYLTSPLSELRAQVEALDCSLGANNSARKFKRAVLALLDAGKEAR